LPGIDVRVAAQGTGQALYTAQRGDADVVFVQAEAQEPSKIPSHRRLPAG
jgi:ABC-type tungstate transport system permease subunit